MHYKFVPGETPSDARALSEFWKGFMKTNLRQPELPDIWAAFPHWEAPRTGRALRYARLLRYDPWTEEAARAALNLAARESQSNGVLRRWDGRRMYGLERSLSSEHWAVYHTLCYSCGECGMHSTSRIAGDPRNATRSRPCGGCRLSRGAGGKFEAYSDDHYAGDAETAEALLIRHEEALRLRMAVERLKPAHAQVIRDYFGLGVKAKNIVEIAETLGLTNQAISYRLAAALREFTPAALKITR